MAGNINSICKTSDELMVTMTAFKKRKGTNTAALIIKIDKESMGMVLDEKHEDVTIEEVAQELPESQPRYLYYSHVQRHNDGRISYPQLMVFVSPEGCKPEMMMMYAGSYNDLKMDSGATRSFQVRSAEELTQEWLEEVLTR